MLGMEGVPLKRSMTAASDACVLGKCHQHQLLWFRLSLPAEPWDEIIIYNMHVDA